MHELGAHERHFERCLLDVGAARKGLLHLVPGHRGVVWVQPLELVQDGEVAARTQPSLLTHHSRAVYG
jgi:hypothetical protein